MIKIKKTVAGGLYIFQGKASGNSSFIEDLHEARQFILSANHYLKGYLKIHEYLLDQHGWVFIVRIHSLKKLRRTLSIDKTDELDPQLVWRIISERMRILLSNFVKFTNKKQRRTGSKVHSSYERFLFESLREAEAYLEMMRRGKIRLYQSRKKYRAKKSHYKVPKKWGKGSIFINSSVRRRKVKSLRKKLDALKKQVLKAHVLQLLIFQTKNSTGSSNKSHNLHTKAPPN